MLCAAGAPTTPCNGRAHLTPDTTLNRQRHTRTCFQCIPARQHLPQQAQHGRGIKAAQVAQRRVWVLGERGVAQRVLG